MREKCIQLLKMRGVEIEDIVECVVYLQKDYVDDINTDKIHKDILGILDKREVQHAVLTGIVLDRAVENHHLGDNDIEEIIRNDEGLYGIDEVLAYGICNIYGSIALTNFGYIDRTKPGIIGRLNDATDGKCHTFLDDIVGAIAASSASKLAHSRRRKRKSA